MAVLHYFPNPPKPGEKAVCGFSAFDRKSDNSDMSPITGNCLECTKWVEAHKAPKIDKTDIGGIKHNFDIPVVRV